MRILYVSTIGMTSIFFKDLIGELIRQGHTVDFACNNQTHPVDERLTELGCRIYQIDFSRSPLKKKNLTACRQLKEIVGNGHYDIVHCHTPVASACTRLVCRRLRKKSGLKVFYTAHGFHFYRGASMLNWMVYYPVERILSRMTDVLVTINSEDYAFAQRKMKAGRVAYTPGVGIDVDRFSKAKTDKAEKRRSLGIPGDAFLLISVGELNSNKNHQAVIRAIAQLHDPKIYYMIAGKGPLDEELASLAESLGVGERLLLLGFREDVKELYPAADVNVFPSIREGFGLAAIEGFAAGLPLICGDNRGTRSYAVDTENALVCPNNAVEEYAQRIRLLYFDEELRRRMSRCAEETARRFSVETINGMIIALYREYDGRIE